LFWAVESVGNVSAQVSASKKLQNRIAIPCQICGQMAIK
jgi:hypothetical protein